MVVLAFVINRHKHVCSPRRVRSAAMAADLVGVSCTSKAHRVCENAYVCARVCKVQGAFTDVHTIHAQSVA